jgi:hypothetical protein
MTVACIDRDSHINNAFRRFCFRAGNAEPRWVAAPIILIKAHVRGDAGQWRKIARRTSFAGMSK